MELLLPHTGTLIWMTLSFSIALFILTKFAWKPIMAFLKARENTIENALKAAESAKEEMTKLKKDNEKIIAEAKLQREVIIKEARELKESIINEAKAKAVEEARRIVELANEATRNERASVINEIKQQIALLSIQVAEKLLQEKLVNDTEQKDLIDKLVREIKLN